jgi:hypothetical protein
MKEPERPQVVSTRLTADAARVLTDEVKADAVALWSKFRRLYEGDAHAALDYSSWGAYYEAEFDQSANYGYRLLKSAEVMEQLPIGNSRPSSEAVARELAPALRDNKVEEVWEEVVAEYGPEPTAAQTRGVVRKHQQKDEPVKAECPVCGTGVLPNKLFGGRHKKLLATATEEQLRAVLDDKRRKAVLAGPADYGPDVMSDDAERIPRYVAMRWFERGHNLQGLVDEGLLLESRSAKDREAIVDAADEMIEIAERVKREVR